MKQKRDSVIKGIVFDFDGVLADSEPAHFRALAELVAPRPLEWTEYKRDLVGVEDRLSIAKLLQLSHDSETLEALIDKKSEIFKRHAPHLRLHSGVIELIDEILLADLRLGLCSGSVAADIHAVLARVHSGRLLAHFETIVTADDVKWAKPDPEGYRRTVRALGVLPTECVALEDSFVGLRAAREAGLKTIAVAHTLASESLRPHADFVIEKLEGFTLANLLELFK